MTPTFLSTNVLPHIEGTSFSTPNTRQLIKRGHALVALEQFLQMLEAGAGVTRTFVCSGLHRCLEEFQNFIHTETARRGRRLRDAALPVDWSRFGVYELHTDDGAVSVRRRCIDGLVVVPARDLPTHSTVDELFLDCNWSDKDAVIKSKSDSDTSFSVGLLFKTHIVQADKQPLTEK